MDQPTLCDFDRLPAREIVPGVLHRHVSGAGATFAWLRLAKGSEVPEHHHPHEQITYIPEGHVRVTTPAGVYEVKAGQVLVIPPNVPHHFLALEDTLDFDIFQPVRQDFETGWNPER